MKCSLLVPGVVIALSAFAFAGDMPKAAEKPIHPGFERMKSLVGTWELADQDNNGKPDGTVVYRMTSANSVVLETLFPGSDHEMITTYHNDNGKLRVTHYCALGNQPSMIATASDANSITFTFDKGCNLDAAKDSYMGGLKVTFKDADHFEAAWTHYAGGKAGEPHAFAWTRTK